jgi:hypothetical protein
LYYRPSEAGEVTLGMAIVAVRKALKNVSAASEAFGCHGHFDIGSRDLRRLSKIQIRQPAGRHTDNHEEEEQQDFFPHAS